MGKKKREVVRSEKVQRYYRKLGKVARLAGYAGSAITFVAGIYWFLIPKGWVVGILLVAISVFIAIETRRVLRT